MNIQTPFIKSITPDIESFSRRRSRCSCMLTSTLLPFKAHSKAWIKALSTQSFVLNFIVGFILPLPDQASGLKDTSTKTPQGQSTTVQCKGTTKAGTRCKHMTSIANGYCYQHQPNNLHRCWCSNNKLFLLQFSAPTTWKSYIFPSALSLVKKTKRESESGT